jgi:hypothetical protein
MTIENINELDVWILDSHDLVVSILPFSAPWNAMGEGYEIEQPGEY